LSKTPLRDACEGELCWLQVFSADSVEAFAVIDEFPEGLEAFKAARVAEVKMEVSVFTELFAHVVAGALDVLVVGEVWIVGFAVEDSASEDILGNDVVVRVGDDSPIQRARRVVCRGAVILNGFLHQCDLFLREPTQEGLVGLHEGCRGEVVGFASPWNAEVVVCGDGIGHVFVRAAGAGEEQAFSDGCFDMAAAVAIGEGFVLGQDLLFDVGNEVFVHGVLPLALMEAVDEVCVGEGI